MANFSRPETPGLTVAELLARGQESSPIRNPLSPSQIDPSLRDDRDCSEDSGQSDDESINGFGFNTPVDNDLRMRQLAQAEAHRLHLSQDAMQSLFRFATANAKEQLVRIYSMLLSIGDVQSTHVTEWKPSADAVKNIRQTSVRLMLSPTVPSYKGSSTKMVETKLSQLTNNGLPNGWVDNPAQSAVVSKHIGRELTQARRDIKMLISTSIKPKEGKPLTIKELTDKLTAMGKVMHSVHHWVRFAFLRAILKEHDNEVFWDRVDAFLEETRKTTELRYKDQGIDKVNAAIHKSMKYFLDNDKAIYGAPIGEAMHAGGVSIDGSGNYMHEGGLQEDNHEEAARGPVAHPEPKRRKRAEIARA